MKLPMKKKNRFFLNADTSIVHLCVNVYQTSYETNTSTDWVMTFPCTNYRLQSNSHQLQKNDTCHIRYLITNR